MRTPESAETSETPCDSGLFPRHATMKVQSSNPFPRTSPDSVYSVRVDGISARARRARMPARVLASVLAIGLLQAAPALAGDQVLEIPQLIATPATVRSHRRIPDLYDTVPASNADAAAGTSAPAPPPAKVAANRESYPPDPNLGSIDEYQNQPGENGQRPSFAFGGGGRRSEPPGSITSADLIIGGIILGMVALEVASAHHHRHR
jgi:hypothetical protein